MLLFIIKLVSDVYQNNDTALSKDLTDNKNKLQHLKYVPSM